MIEMNRRSLITGLIGLVAAPAIVRASSLMPVRMMPVRMMPLQHVMVCIRAGISSNEWVEVAVIGQTIVDGIRLWNPSKPYVLGDLVSVNRG